PALHTDELRDIRYEGLEWVKSIALHSPPDGLDPFQPFIANVPQFIGVLYLIDGIAIALVVEKRLLSFPLVVHALLDLSIKGGTILPFLTGDGKNTIVGVQIGGVKGHRGGFALLDDVNG